MLVPQEEKDIFSSVNPPHAIAFLLTSRCNAACIYCPFNRNILSFTRDPELSLLKRRISEAADNGVRNIRLSGGEPLLRLDLEELIAFTTSKGLHCSIVTNGSLLRDNRMDALISAGLGAMTLSVDTLEAELYESLRCLPFERVRRNLELFQRLKREHAPIWTGVTVVITRHNIDQIEKMTVELTEMDIPVQFQPCHSYSDHEENASNQPDVQQLEKVVNNLIKMKKSGYLVNNSQRYLEGVVHFIRTGKPPTSFICQMPWTTAVYDGEMFLRPCCFPLPPIAGSNVNDLMTSWSGGEMNQWRDKIKRGECVGCWLLSLDTWK